MPTDREDIIEYVYRVFRTYGTARVLTELLLIGTVLWMVMGFLRGTRGARLLTGLLLLLLFSHIAVQWVADRWSLLRLQFLYEKFLLLLTLGAVVVFQPELRRALSRLGEASLTGVGRRELNELIEELDEAVRYFARNKIGAIIALERKTGLGAVVETGVPLDAKVTADLLRSIFWPGSALHDLGVIISNGRIAAARCAFPLAEAASVPGSMGSRHRAALGLTEDSDVLVVVVSEETGRISFAERGRLDPISDPDDFRPELSRRLSVGMPTVVGRVTEPAAPASPIVSLTGLSRLAELGGLSPTDSSETELRALPMEGSAELPAIAGNDEAEASPGGPPASAVRNNAAGNSVTASQTASMSGTHRSVSLTPAGGKTQPEKSGRNLPVNP